MLSRMLPGSHSRLCWSSSRAVSMLLPQLGPHRQKLCSPSASYGQNLPTRGQSCCFRQHLTHRSVHRFAAVSGKAEDAEIADHKSSDLHSEHQDVRFAAVCCDSHSKSVACQASLRCRSVCALRPPLQAPCMWAVPELPSSIGCMLRRKEAN